MSCQSILRKFIYPVVLFLVLFSQSAHAEYFGLLHGRSADVSRMPTLSADIGAAFGDDYQLLGVRANYKLTPIFMVYGTFGFGEVGRTDGLPFGVGALYTVENLLNGFDVGVKASYHTGTFKIRSVEYDASNLALEFIISTQAGFGPQGNIDFYGNLGVQSLSSELLLDGVELSVGGGLIMPVGPGEVFVGLDFVDDAMFGGGYRFFF